MALAPEIPAPLAIAPPGVPDPLGAAQDVLRSILRSAGELLGADQGFFLVSRNDVVLEVACTRAIRPHKVIEAVLGRAGAVVQAALVQRQLAGADSRGHLLPRMDGFFEANSPAILCLPLDLGLRQAGVLCLLRKKGARRVSELDWEILQALSEQAALAIGAASHQSALSRLEASLGKPVTA